MVSWVLRAYPQNPFQMTKYLYSSVFICGSKSLKPTFRIGSYGGLTFEETIRDAIASLQAQAQTGLQMSARWCDKMSEKDAIAPPTLASDRLLGLQADIRKRLSPNEHSLEFEVKQVAIAFGLFSLVSSTLASCAAPPQNTQSSNNRDTKLSSVAVTVLQGRSRRS
jgi:hypothetical protein